MIAVLFTGAFDDLEWCESNFEQVRVTALELLGDWSQSFHLTEPITSFSVQEDPSENPFWIFRLASSLSLAELDGAFLRMSEASALYGLGVCLRVFDFVNMQCQGYVDGEWDTGVPEAASIVHL
jgi:hypothetical protein